MNFSNHHFQIVLDRINALLDPNILYTFEFVSNQWYWVHLTVLKHHFSTEIVYLNSRTIIAAVKNIRSISGVISVSFSGITVYTWSVTIDAWYICRCIWRFIWCIRSWFNILLHVSNILSKNDSPSKLLSIFCFNIHEK